MSSLADENYYTDVYKGIKPEGDINILLERASDIVRGNCLYNIGDIEKLPSFMREKLKKAVCAQAEFMEMNGGAEAYAGGNILSASGFSIGKFSMSGMNGSDIPSASRGVSDKMISYLEAAGLLYRGGV